MSDKGDEEYGAEDTDSEEDVDLSKVWVICVLLPIPVGFILSVLVPPLLIFMFLIFVLLLLADVIYTRSVWQSPLALLSIFIGYLGVRNYADLLNLEGPSGLAIPVLMIAVFEFMISYGLGYLYLASRKKQLI